MARLRASSSPRRDFCSASGENAALRRDAISSDAVWKWLGIQSIQDEKLGKDGKRVDVRGIRKRLNKRMETMGISPLFMVPLYPRCPGWWLVPFCGIGAPSEPATSSSSSPSSKQFSFKANCQVFVASLSK